MIFPGDFLHVRCLEFDRSWVGLCIEGTIYLHHMQWNSPKSRCTSISSKVSEAWHVDRWKTEGKLDKKFGFQYVKAGETFSCNLTWNMHVSLLKRNQFHQLISYTWMNETLVFKDHRKLQTCFRHLLSISSAYCFIVLIEIKISSFKLHIRFISFTNFMLAEIVWRSKNFVVQCSHWIVILYGHKTCLYYIVSQTSLSFAE